MKKRDYKSFAPGTFFHVYNRGNNKENIFFDEQDYKAFLFRLGLGLGIEPKTLSKNQMTYLPYARVRISGTNDTDFKIHAFCLMKNHFHLLIEQCSETPISKLISQVCTSYAMYINKKYRRVGHVFQDRFKSVVVESDPQLMWLSAYIHMNPVKSGLVSEPLQYTWSSYVDYVTSRDLSFITTNFLRDLFQTPENFKKSTYNLASRQYVKDVP